MLDHDAESARTLTLVAIILQVIFFIGGAILLFFALLLVGNFTSQPGISSNTYFSTGGFFILAFGIIGIIGLFWILLDYFLIYKPLGEGNVRSAESPALILGILQLLFGGVIPGILLIIAWVKIKDSLRNKTVNATGNP